MQKNQKTNVASLTALFLLASVAAFGQGGEKAKVEGMIVSRAGETLIVNSREGKATVVLDDDTKTQDKRGLFGLEKELLSNSVLIPGLKVKVDGRSDAQGWIVAKTITTDGDDIETSQMIQAGLHPTADQVLAHEKQLLDQEKSIEANKEQIAANEEDIETNQQKIAEHKQNVEQNMKDIEENTNRFTALSDYDVKGQATVKFPVGSSKISPEDQKKLKQLAQTATSLKGYIVEVTGYADATGSAAMNTKLSEDRAKAVAMNLAQQGSVPARHIVAPGAMGEYGPAAPNETEAGRAENRRVEVKVLVNKGIAGS